MAWYPSPNLFNQSVAGGLQNATRLIDLIDYGQQRAARGKIADLIASDNYTGVAEALARTGQTGPAMQAAQVPYNRQQQAMEQDWRRKVFQDEKAYRDANMAFQQENALAGRDLQRENIALARERMAADMSGAGKYTTPFQAQDENGNPVFLQANSAGEVRPVDGYAPLNPIKTVDTGTEIVAVDSRTNQVLSRTPKQNTQAEFDKSYGRETGKMQAELPAMRRKAEGTMNSLNRQWEVVNQDIDKAIGQANTLTTGIVGSVMDSVPGTAAHDLKNTLMTIKANIGFDKLQDMRDNSPTGGALGQVSEFENRLLQSVNGALEQSQTRQQLVDNLERVKVNLRNLQVERTRAFNDTFSNYQMPQPASDNSIVKVPSANMAGKTPETAIPLASESEANSLPVGTYVIINGRPGVIE